LQSEQSRSKSQSTSSLQVPHIPTRPQQTTNLAIRIVEWLVTPQNQDNSPSASDPVMITASSFTLHILLFPTDVAPLAKQFWQHTGEIISSRFAEYCLQLVDSNQRSKGFSGLEHAFKSQKRNSTAERFKTEGYRVQDRKLASENAFRKASHNELNVFVEERFGRNLDIRYAKQAKLLLRKRIAGILGDSAQLEEQSSPQEQVLLVQEEDKCPPTPRIQNISEDHVFLFPSGMSSIYNAYRTATKLRPNLKTVQYGFPYLDTLKIQEKFGTAGCIFLGHGSSEELEKLENEILPSTQIAALFCEFPSNPLLKSADLKKIRALADKFGFLVIVDETIGNMVNTGVLEWADIVVSSLTKIFSGDCNVMGGR
jgi:cystathionine gamma-synthase